MASHAVIHVHQYAVVNHKVLLQLVPESVAANLRQDIFGDDLKSSLWNHRVIATGDIDSNKQQRPYVMTVGYISQTATGTNTAIQ